LILTDVKRESRGGRSLEAFEATDTLDIDAIEDHLELTGGQL
jgi:hypothetical protein